MKTFILAHVEARSRALEAVRHAPDGYWVQIRAPKRSDVANRRMWAMLHDIAEQHLWYGVKLSAEEFKHIFSAGLHKAKVVPGLDGGFVVLGQSTSNMSQSEISDMMMLMEVFGAEKGIKFKEPV